MSLSTKIENLLDLILPPFKLERATECGGDGGSSSEDSVDYNEVDLGKTLIKDFYENDEFDYSDENIIKESNKQSKVSSPNEI